MNRDFPPAASPITLLLQALDLKGNAQIHILEDTDFRLTAISEETGKDLSSSNDWSNQDDWISLEGGTASHQLFSEERNIKQGSCCWSHFMKKILAKRLGTTESWITFVLWIVSISIDPLFCYVAVSNDEKKFLEINIRLLIFLLVIFVVLHAYKFRIYLQLELAGSLGRKQRVNFILAEFITPFFGKFKAPSLQLNAS
ncbi:hypothetical protein Q3G72_002457 [Acer saccharum]|nr:hypothetical protein Q3G72_002457 [Acer saccharum]